MELKSLEYVLFAALVIVAYFSASKIENAQKYVLLAANLFFIYTVSGLSGLLMISVLVLAVFLLAIQIEKAVKDRDKQKAKRYMWCAVIGLIAVLCYFKFFSNTLELVQNALANCGISVSSLLSPIGISYYTLTMIAYIVDVYHKKHPAEKEFTNLFVLITYFPSIVQGPINLYKKVAPQLTAVHKPEEKRIIMGVQRALWGYFKKVVIADRIGIVVLEILKDEGSFGMLLLWSMVLYSFQIYADFSGGIDVVMGISEILDIHLTENFKAPLVSKSVTEYWARWHMSLGEFMEKYLYYPVVLNRSVMKFSKKIPNKYFQKVFSATLASVIVFVIVGIWHGTGWNYVVYGCYQAVFVSSAVLLGPVYKEMRKKYSYFANGLSWRIFQSLRTFAILTVGRFFIRAKNLTQAFDLLRRTFLTLRPQQLYIFFDGTLRDYGLDRPNLTLMNVCILLLILVDILHDRNIHFRETLMKQDIVFRYIVYLVAIFGIIILGIYGPGFSSASFIYQEF